MKTIAPKTNWLTIAQKMAEDKKRIATALAAGTSVPHDIRLVQPPALRADAD